MTGGMPGSGSRSQAEPYIHCSPESALRLLATEKLPQELGAAMNALPSLARSKMHLPSCEGQDGLSDSETVR